MPCLPDIWEYVKGMLPAIGLLLAFIAYTALPVYLLTAPRIIRRWIRIAFRVLGVLLLVPLAAVLPVVFFGLALASGNPPAQTRIVQSVIGEEAGLRYQAGFLGRDYTAVTLKQSGCCKRTTIFWHQGPSWFNDLQLQWLSRSHLVISYHTRPDDPMFCQSHLGGVTITCIAQPWPQ